MAYRLTILIPNHLKFELQKVWYSNVSGFQIPTVLHVLIFQSNSIPGSRDLSPCSSPTDRLAHPRLGSIQTSTDGKAQKSFSVCAIFNICNPFDLCYFKCRFFSDIIKQGDLMFNVY